MNMALILLSFIVSMAVSGLMFQRKNRKIWCIATALLVNTAIIGITLSIIYSLDHEMQSFGVGIEETFMPLIAIPVLTWLNAALLSFFPAKTSSENR